MFSCGHNSWDFPGFIGHQVADSLGLHHESRGEGKERHLVVSRRAPTE